MSYELLALPVPPGAEIEEAGEALEVRLVGGHLYRDATPEGAARRRALAAVAVGADPDLTVSEDAADGPILLTTTTGVSVQIDTSFVVFRVGYGTSAASAVEVFERLFRVVGAVVRETGWCVYDPQEACAVDAGDAGRDSTLEIFLTVLDQLQPGNASRPR